MPFFSIILPTFNRAHLLPKAIESVITQTFTDWELIIVDDGSTDKTKALVESYTDIRIRYLYQTNQERSAARNNGINNANGEYICFLDSDDCYLSNNLELWEEFYKTHNFPKVFSYSNILIVQNAVKTKIILEPVFNNVFDFLFTNPLIPARMSIHRSLLEKDLFEKSISIGEDVCLWLKLALQNELLYSPHESVEYYIHAENSVNPKNPVALKMIEGYSWFFNNNPEIKAKISSAVFKSYLSKIRTNIAKHHLIKGEKTKATLELLKAIFLSPIHEHTKFRVRLIVLILFSRNPQLNE